MLRHCDLSKALFLSSCLALALLSTEHVEADEWTAFLKSHCADCHTGPDAQSAFDVTTLTADFQSVSLFQKWERIYDRVHAGEMPPKSADLPPPAERNRFTNFLANQLTAAHQARKETVLRRLNRREYENTLNDTFGTNRRLAALLPEDGRSHEFDNVAEALSLSPVQLQRYLEAIPSVLDEAVQRTVERPEAKVKRASYADTRGGEQWLGKIWLKRDDGAVVFFKNYGYPSGMLREASNEQDGWYKVRVTGYAYQSERPITFALGATTFARGQEEPTFGYFELPPGASTTIETVAYIPARYMIEVTVQGITDRYALKKTPVAEYTGAGLAIQHIELEGPLVDEFPSRGHRLLFDGLPRTEVIPRNPAERNNSWYKPKFEITGQGSDAEIRPALHRIASKAFRRPTSATQIEPYLTLFRAEKERGASVEEALRTAVTAIYTAPEFLYLQETPGRLDDYALASRLSYFLQRTTPDDELLSAAEAGKLTQDPQELVRHAERLLADPRSVRFVTDFTDAWLNLREIEFTAPDGQLFPEFDPYLQWSMIEETRTYFRKLLDDNLPVRNVMKSDFAMLNERLAEHYGIDGVDGPALRPVSLAPGSVRGGFLTQGAVLKVSANGTNTSPVVRGVWVTERILGESVPPPPPGIPGVEPDIRGATTLRERLEKHRALESCKGCHQQIDPPGFALECFDPIGGWRDRFRTLGGKDRVTREVRGQKVRYTLGQPVDSAGVLLDGRSFSGYIEFRDMLAAHPERLATSLTRKLLTFATGRDMGFSDRAEIDRIVKQAAASEYGIRDLVRLIVSSETFRTR